VLAGRPWKAAETTGSTEVPSLRLSGKAKVRAGARVKLRWIAAGVSAVEIWRVSLDRRVVATVPVAKAGFSRRAPRPGSHRWRVVGLDATGDKVVAATRTFRVVRGT
jgi:hypothetical protein